MTKPHALKDPHHLSRLLALPSSLHSHCGPGHTGAHAPKYLLEDDVRMALRLAWARSRPLLVLGEAGLGKSQLAAALAQEWGVPLLTHTVQSTTTAQDLFWQFDAVQRLAGAQVLGAMHKDGSLTEAIARQALDPLKYVTPGVLWWAWAWQQLRDEPKGVGAAGGRQLVEPIHELEWQPGNGCVLLIDEIDKAPPDLPNNLLDCLESGGFALPWSGERVALPEGARPPLIIITSNGDRDLPAAFRRRCFQARLEFGGQGADQAQWLCERAAVHFGDEEKDSDLTKAAAQQILALRKAAPEGDYKPGVSEFLDLLYSVKKLEPDPAKQAALVTQLAPFVSKPRAGR